MRQLTRRHVLILCITGQTSIALSAKAADLYWIGDASIRSANADGSNQKTVVQGLGQLLD